MPRYTIAAKDNTYTFPETPAYQPPKVKKSCIRRYWDMVGYEFSLNMLQPSERVILHIGFWCSFAYTMYQFYVLYAIFAAEGATAEAGSTIA